jgi:hypothetical protein
MAVWAFPDCDLNRNDFHRKGRKGRDGRAKTEQISAQQLGIGGCFGGGPVCTPHEVIIFVFLRVLCVLCGALFFESVAK